MKKLLNVLFMLTLAFVLVAPVFTQDTGSQEAPKAEKVAAEKKAKKEKKPKKEKKAKTEKMEEAPKQ